MIRQLRVITTVLVAVAIAGAFRAATANAAPPRPRKPPRPHHPPRQHKRPRLHRHNPVGIGGHWRIVFDDEFNGTALNQTVWNAHIGWTNQNAVTDHLCNLKVRDGRAIFRLASRSSGAEIETNRFRLGVGEYAEARIKFAGDGQTIYNWPAWWISGPDWPHSGENDIAEGLGSLTVNYHSPDGALETGTVDGVWARGFHIYGIYRGRFDSRVYWDGKLVRTYPTHDNGQAENLWLTIGAANVIRTGAAGQMVVDYVRAWKPA